MFKNLRDLTDFGSTGWVRVYQVWDAAGVVVAKVTATPSPRLTLSSFSRRHKAEK